MDYNKLFILKMNNLKINTLFLIIVISVFSFSQNRFNHPDNPETPNSRFFFSEINAFPSLNDNWVLCYTFRIPYNHLVFVKDNTVYKAGFSLAIEVTDTLGNFVDRQIKDFGIVVSNYQETDSGLLFYQGMLTFHLHKANYNFLPIITDINSKDELKLKKIQVLASTERYKNLLPLLVLNNKKVKCGNNENPVLTNYDGLVPFNNSNYDLIIPSIDTTIENLKAIIINDEDTVFNSNINESNVYSLDFQVCDSQIVLDQKGEIIPTRNFIIRNLSNHFLEGNLTFLFFKDDGTKPFITQYRQCIWFDKPNSLMNPEFAIKILKYMTNNDEIGKLLGVKEKNYKKELFNFWKKYDATPSTQFNEVMSEYYKRVDYTAKNFGSVSNKKGFETDRGRIYIQNGQPKKIERNSNSDGKVYETWFYDKGKQFIFIDKQGTGEFPLQNG
jgi:GWxTD domain-containing protein